VWVDAGELLGRYHGDETAMFDYRLAPLSEPNPMWNVNDDSVSTYDYFPEPLRSSYLAPIATFPLEVNHALLDNPIARTAMPKEGAFFFEIAGKARGNWGKTGGTYYPDANKAALVLDYSGDGSYQDFSLGPTSSPMAAQRSRRDSVEALRSGARVLQRETLGVRGGSSILAAQVEPRVSLSRFARIPPRLPNPLRWCIDDRLVATPSLPRASCPHAPGLRAGAHV